MAVLDGWPDVLVRPALTRQMMLMLLGVQYSVDRVQSDQIVSSHARANDVSRPERSFSSFSAVSAHMVVLFHCASSSGARISFVT